MFSHRRPHPPFSADDLRTEFFARERTAQENPLTLSVTSRVRCPKAPIQPRRPGTRAIPLACREARVSPSLKDSLPLAAHHRDPFQKPERLSSLGPTTRTVCPCLALASSRFRFFRIRAPHLGFAEFRRGGQTSEPKLCRLDRFFDTHSRTGFHRRARPSRQSGYSPAPERHVPPIDFCNPMNP